MKSEYSASKPSLFGNIVLTQNQKICISNISKSGYKSVTIDGEFFEAKGGTVVIDINSKISKLTKIISMSSSIDGLFQSINLKRNTSKKKFA